MSTKAGKKFVEIYTLRAMSFVLGMYAFVHC